MFRIITISREQGSGGSEIARRLAERLGWKLIDDELVTEIARRANVDPELARRLDECVDSWFHRLTKALWRGGYEGVASRVEGGMFDAEAMAAFWTRVIREAAGLGSCVIVGRGGQCILSGQPDAFHVSVHAPRAQRVERLRKLYPAETDPAALAEESDRRREAYVHQHFGIDWKDYRLYHLVLNSSIGIEPAVEAVLRAAGLAGENR
jgi:cytidylate kinase